jgi:hypothetical protein
VEGKSLQKPISRYLKAIPWLELAGEDNLGIHLLPNVVVFFTRYENEVQQEYGLLLSLVPEQLYSEVVGHVPRYAERGY